MKKNILFINGHLNCGGVERSLSDILRNFDYNNYNVDLLLLEEYGDYLSEIPQEVNIKLIDLHNTYGSVKESLLRCLRKKDFKCFFIRIIFIITKLFGIQKLSLAKKIFTNKHYDIAIGFRPGICMSIAAFAVKADKAVGWWHHGEYNLTDNETIDFIAGTQKLDKIICVSEGCKTLLSTKFPELCDKFNVIANMVDSEEIRQKSLMPCMEKFNKSELNILTVGRLAPEKRIENVIFVAKNLIDNGFTKFKWHIVGDGEEKSKLLNLSKMHNVENYIIFHGNQPNPYAFMRNSNLLIHTSYVESQCLVVLEAMAVGIPCVITQSIGPSEFAINDNNCILAEPNLDSLIEATNKLINYNNKQELINNAYETVNSYSPENIMKKIYEI